MKLQKVAICVPQVCMFLDSVQQTQDRALDSNKTLHQGAIYGACMNRVFENMQKDSCLKEFQAFKECLKVHLPHSSDIVR
jgi:hypothetical protein